MKVELVGFSQMVNVHGDPMSLAELAASVCYDSKPTKNCSIVKQYKSKRKYCSHACANRGRAVKEGGTE